MLIVKGGQASTDLGDKPKVLSFPAGLHFGGLQRPRGRKNPPIRRSGGSSVRLLLLRRLPRPSFDGSRKSSSLQLGHLEQRSRPRLVAKRHERESLSRHPAPGRRRRSSGRSRQSTSPGRPLFAFRQACAAATKPSGHATRRSSRPIHRVVS